MKRYLTADGTTPKPEGHVGAALKVETFYGKGGTNWVSGNQEGRGYYLSVMKVSIDEHGVEQYVLFSGGLKKLVLPVNRQGAKAAAQAEIEAEKFIPELVAATILKATAVN